MTARAWIEPAEPWPSAAPEVLAGPGAVHRLPQLVADLGVRRVLLICGRRSFTASGAEQMLPELERLTQVERFSDFAPNTDSADLRTALRRLEQAPADLVLGIGGGSALDLAKLLVAYEGTPPDEVVARIEQGASIPRRRTRLVLAPTTSGSGAEATHFAVVYVGETKYSIAGAALRADGIVLDPGLTTSATPYQRATSGIDAVAQAIESLWATGATDRSRAFARRALRLLVPAIGPYVDEPASPTAAGMMAIGSHLAGRAIDISKTTAAHALSYGLTKRFGVSHGHAVALTLGAFLDLHAQAEPSHLQPSVDPARHAEAMASIASLLGAEHPEGAAEAFRAMLDRTELTQGLRAVGAEAPEDRAVLAGAVNAERLGNNPVAFDHAGLIEVLERSA